MRYSPSRNAFYDPALQVRYEAAGSWPDDAVDLTDAEYAEFSGPAPEGKRLAAVAGRPGWADAPRFSSAATATRAVVAHIDAATHQITGDVPDDEKVSWPVKALAAQAYTAGSADFSQTSMLFDEAEKTGESVDGLAVLIVSRASAYAAAIAPLTGIRRAAARDLAAAPDAASIETIVDAAFAEIDATLAAVLAAHSGD